MAEQRVDKGRRRFLTNTVAAVGGAGVLAAAVPFVSSWKPSARAEAAGAPVEADISKIRDGQILRFEWRGRPVWVVKRTPEMLAALDNHRESLSDPDSAKSEQPEYIEGTGRSIRDDIVVLVGVCTHLGCSPKFVPEMTAQPFDADWNGGFFCPCHNSRFDLSGRVYAGVPAPLNLPVPPHHFAGDNNLIIGLNPGEAA